MSTLDELNEPAERVARLERRLGAVDPMADSRTADPDLPHQDRMRPDDPFWALAALKARTAEPAVLYAGVVRLAGHGDVEWQMAHPSQVVLDEVWSNRSATLASLGHPVRLRILQLIAQGEHLTAADLADTMGLGTTGQIYHHLRQLVAAGWLRSTSKGRHQIPPERVVPLLVILAASR